MNKLLNCVFLGIFVGIISPLFSKPALVMQSDFGTADGEVAVMVGVAHNVDEDLAIYHITHDIPKFNIWEAGYKLWMTAPYWRNDTVFVSVVDPGVGTKRRSVVLKTKNGQYFVSPDNGSLSLVAEAFGIEGVREIDESVNRRKGSEESHTFHGRDVYSYTGARLAAGVITFEGVGPLLKPEVLKIDSPAANLSKDSVTGFIPYIDKHFGNTWSNIELEMFNGLNPKTGERFDVTIKKGDKVVFNREVPYFDTFGEVKIGQPVIFINSRLFVSIALRQGHFAKAHNIESGPEWTISFSRK